jgi:hypothetical protein
VWRDDDWNDSMNSWTSARSTRNTPPVPAQLPLRPNEVTPATTLLVPRKFGPPEALKQVPPVWALVDRSSE